MYLILNLDLNYLVNKLETGTVSIGPLIKLLTVLNLNLHSNCNPFFLGKLSVVGKTKTTVVSLRI